MKLSVFLMFAFSFTAMANVKLMSQTISVDFHETELSVILQTLKEQSGKVIVYSNTKIESEKHRVTLKLTNSTLDLILSRVLENLPYSYSIVNDVVYIIPTPVKAPVYQAPQNVSVRGRVTDQAGLPLTGVTVIVKGTNRGIATDADGRYELIWPGVPGTVLVYSFLGMVTQEIAYTGQREINVVMAEEAHAIEDVVVMGYFDRTRQSFTGAEVSVRGEELRKLGATNLLTAISSFDPAVMPIPNNEYGSDPNRIPEITIRGESGFDLRSSADDSRSNPNSPLYILDGIEVSATKIYDMDLNRIEAFSILKDAAATALYGSRGANGVILIQTVSPREGEVRITVNANYFLSFPDLRDYNLMNAAEKLDYEMLAGVYTAKWLVGATQDELDLRYNHKLSEIARGVNTYWLSRPVHTSLNQRYSTFIEGGDSRFRYGIDVRYDNDKGVMKGSDRERLGANFKFSYHISNELVVVNDISVDNTWSENSAYGAFSSYVRLNPYERIYDPQTGEMIRRYGDNNDIINPLINSTLPNYDKTAYTDIRDNFSLDWRITDHFLVRGRAGITQYIEKAEAYMSPFSTAFDRTEDESDRGRYTTLNGKKLNFDSNIRVQYSNYFADKYSLSVGTGVEMKTENMNGDGYTAVGFLNDKMNFVEYAQKFPDNSRPVGTFDKQRLIGFLSNVNIGYDDRYFIDAMFRSDGSSRFGRESRFAPFWSVGASWNVNNEKWWTTGSTLKIRASIGVTGKTNFDADQAITKYIYEADYEYNGYNGAVLAGYGNPALKWQNTLMRNVGFDMSVLNGFLNFIGDFYVNKTQNLLLDIDTAPSTGFLKYKENMGSMRNTGIEGRLRLNLIRDSDRDLTWSVTLHSAAIRNKIISLSNALEAMNEEANSFDNVTSATPLRTYQTGRSQSALMVVRSAGIDPATGNEVYVKLNGDLTLDYDPKDKIIVGDTKPKIHGDLKSNLNYKGFELYAQLRYQFGAVTYNSTLATKVEGVDPRYNADKRVLYERWKKPGDIAMFRRIDDQSILYQTSRLVQDNDFVNLETLSLGYTVPASMLKGSFIERARIMFTTNNLLRISTIRMERGTLYPFAQSFSLGVNVIF